VGRDYELRLLATDGPGRVVKAGGARTDLRRVADAETSGGAAVSAQVEIVKARLLTVRRQRLKDEQRISLQPLAGSLESLSRRLELMREETVGRDRF
jgi:hypothetical protein